MNLKSKLTLILMLLGSVIMIAQENYSLTGTVVSGVDQMGIPGANVLIKGSTTGASTDFNGNYQLDVKSGDVLLFSYIGYVTQSVTVTNQTTLDIALAEDADALDEIIVVGYGKKKKSHLTGECEKSRKRGAGSKEAG